VVWWLALNFWNYLLCGVVAARARSDVGQTQQLAAGAREAREPVGARGTGPKCQRGG
jgi:hypothetical protein